MEIRSHQGIDQLQRVRPGQPGGGAAIAEAPSQSEPAQGKVEEFSASEELKQELARQRQGVRDVQGVDPAQESAAIDVGKAGQANPAHQVDQRQQVQQVQGIKEEKETEGVTGRGLHTREAERHARPQQQQDVSRTSAVEEASAAANSVGPKQATQQVNNVGETGGQQNAGFNERRPNQSLGRESYLDNLRQTFRLNDGT